MTKRQTWELLKKQRPAIASKMAKRLGVIDDKLALNIINHPELIADNLINFIFDNPGFIKSIRVTVK